jgi:eukaryotic translation initiation factor 2C
MGGSNATLSSACMQKFNDVPCMIMGADVSHPSPQSRDPSCAAVVGSLDREGVVYGTEISIQTSRQEHIEELVRMTTGLLERFKKRNHVYPRRVIMYRRVSAPRYAR